MRQHIPTNEREKLLESSEPVLTFGARDESRLQHQLDVVTLQNLKMFKKQQAKLRKEFNSSVAQVDLQLKKIFTGKNMCLLDGIASQKMHNVALDVSCKDVTASAVQVASKQNPPFQTDNDMLKGKALIASISRPLCSSRLFAFPVSFDKSEFNSSIRWAEVAFMEASVVVLGPACNPKKPTLGQLPNPLMVSVACYLLNEVLKRDSKMQGLWNLLRSTIFDSIYSPLRIDSEVPCQGPQLEHRTNTWIAADQADSQGMSTGSQMSSSYETALDFSNYRLWIEEVAALQHKNNLPSEHVQELKKLLKKSYYLLQMERRRTDSLWLQRVFLAWRRHTRCMKLFRNAVLAFISNNIRRRVERQCFLRWRRSVLQDKLEKLNRVLLEHKHEDHMNEQTHINTIFQLRNQLLILSDAKQLMEAEMEDQLLDLKESHKMTEKALRTAYKRSVRYAERYKTHSRRWERLAKTFRPSELCPRVPKVLLALGVSLTRHEADLSKPYHVTTLRMFVARKELSKFLLCWVNTLMAASPQGKVWVPREHIMNNTSSRSDSIGSSDVTTKSKLMNATALLLLVRELRRLHDVKKNPKKLKREDPEMQPVGSSSSNPEYGVDEMRIVLKEAYEVLSVYTLEGFYPCLLLHCSRPIFQLRSKVSKGANSGKSRQPDEVEYFVSMLWILAALFTGFVHYHYGVEAFMPLRWPQALRCKNEDKLQHSAKQSLGAAELLSFDELANKSTHSAKPFMEDGDIAASQTRNSNSGTTIEPSEPPALGFTGTTTLLTSNSKMFNTEAFPQSQEHIYENASYTNAITDTNSDIEVYTGIKDADLPPNGWENDVDGLLNDIVRAEEHEMRKRRRLRRKEEKFAATMRTVGEVEPRSYRVESGISNATRGQNLNTLYSLQKSIPKDCYLVTPRNSCNDGSETRSTSVCAAIDSPDSVSSHHINSETDDTSVSDTTTDSENEENTSGEATTVPSLGGRRLSKRRLFRRLDAGLDAIREEFSSKVPPPSLAFDVRNGKRKKKKRFTNSILLQSTGERTEARRLQRTGREGLHSFVEHVLIDRERRQEWLGMARVVISLVTRLRLLDIESKKKKNAKIDSAERMGALGSGQKDNDRALPKQDSEARISVSQHTKMKGSFKRRNASSTTIVQILPDGVADVNFKICSSSYEHRGGKVPHAADKVVSTKQMLGHVKGGDSSVERCVDRKQAYRVASAETERNSLINVSSNQSKYNHNTMMKEECIGPDIPLLGSTSALAPVFTERTSFPPVSFRQDEHHSTHCRSRLRKDSLPAREGVRSRCSSASESSFDRPKSLAARTLSHSPPLKFPQGPLDPLITCPEVRYRAAKSTMLYRFDLKDNKK